MAFIEWNESFQLGVQQIDEHHQQLVRIINRLYDNHTMGAPRENVEEILNELVDYATYHFVTEEFWMEQHAYPGSDEHVTAHDEFSQQIAAMREKHQDGQSDLSLEVFTFLKNWLADHILRADAEYGSYLRSENLSIT